MCTTNKNVYGHFLRLKYELNASNYRSANKEKYTCAVVEMTWGF